MSKKSRLSNLSYSDKFLLLELVTKHRNIVDNKKTDAVSSRIKEDCWRQLSEEFSESFANFSSSGLLSGKY